MIKKNLALLNEAAQHDEYARRLTYPRRDRLEDSLTVRWLRRLEQTAD